MYIISIQGREEEGAYSAIDEEGENVLYMFEEYDDAERFAMLLEEEDFPTMTVLEVPTAEIVKSCKIHDFKYVIFDENDIVVPPDNN